GRPHLPRCTAGAADGEVLRHQDRPAPGRRWHPPQRRRAAMTRSTFQINLVSLADIVSNLIGMLILFALVTVLQTTRKIERAQVAAEHETRRLPVFFLCQGQAIVPLDPRGVSFAALERLAQRPAG